MVLSKPVDNGISASLRFSLQMDLLRLLMILLCLSNTRVSASLLF